VIVASFQDQERRAAMRSMFEFAVPLALALAVQPAQAQLMGPAWETNVVLTQADVDMIKGALAAKIHGQRQGTTASWTNAKSGNSGAITLVAISTRDGRRCEQIEYRMVAANRTTADRYVLTSCRQADGSWKLS
jgi:hypothetical protein